MLSLRRRRRPPQISPLGRTASRPRIRSRAVPKRSTATPPALVETTPPRVAVPSEARLRGNRRPASAAAAWTSARVTPASATRTSSTGSTSRMVRIRRVDNRTSPWGIWPPTRPVFPPWTVRATPSAAQRRTMAAVSCVEAGDSMSGVAPLQRSRHSTRRGARISGSSVQPKGPTRALSRFSRASEGGKVIREKLGARCPGSQSAPLSRWRLLPDAGGH